MPKGLRLEDLPFDRARGEVIMTNPGDIMRAWPRHVFRITLLAVGAGGERVVGEYVFDHTPFRP